MTKQREDTETSDYKEDTEKKDKNPNLGRLQIWMLLSENVNEKSPRSNSSRKDNSAAEKRHSSMDAIKEKGNRKTQKNPLPMKNQKIITSMKKLPNPTASTRNLRQLNRDILTTEESDDEPKVKRIFIGGLSKD